MWASGSLATQSGKGAGSKFGLMGVCTKGTGKTTKRTSTADCCIKTETFTRASGRTTKRTASATTSTKMARSIAATGRMTLSMGEAWRGGLTAANLRASTNKESSRARGHLHGLMATATKATLLTITLMAKVSKPNQSISQVTPLTNYLLFLLRNLPME